MGLVKEFKEFAMKGSVVDLAVGVIIGASFGKIVSSLVEDIIMPPLGKAIGNLDFTNLYISLSDKIDAANAAKAVPTTQSALGGVTEIFNAANRLPLAEAKKLGPVIAWGNFVTTSINFIIVAMAIFAVIKLMNVAKRKPVEQLDVPPSPPTKEEVLLAEIRDAIKSKGV